MSAGTPVTSSFGTVYPPSLRAAGSRVTRLSDRFFGPPAASAARGWSDDLGVPPYFLHILFLIEDKRFPLHIGVDPLAILRALVCDVAHQGIIEGASTLTQQLYDIRELASAPRPRTWSRKVRQALWALSEDSKNSKVDLLRKYLSTVYWGRMYYGLAEASNGYFGVETSNLSRAQSFFLVERLASPNVVLLHRVASILSRDAVRDLTLSNSADGSELVGAYDEVFGTGEMLWRALAKLPRQ